MGITEVHPIQPKFEVLPLEILARTIAVESLDRKTNPGSFGWPTRDPSGTTVVIPQGTELVLPNGAIVTANADVWHGFRFDEKYSSPLFWAINGPNQKLGIDGRILVSDVHVVKYPQTREEVFLGSAPRGIYTLTRPLQDGEDKPIQEFYKNLDMARQVLRMSREEFLADSSPKSREYLQNDGSLESAMRFAPTTYVENAIHESFGLVNVGQDGVKNLLDVLSEMFVKFEALGYYTVSRYWAPGAAYFRVKGDEQIPERMMVLASYLRSTRTFSFSASLSFIRSDSQRYKIIAREYERQLEARNPRRAK
ncbi:hypothetical protein HYW99_02590 [Candidatus Woesearchaeota archaeon]|nr:hypothetical protein [Candidatus Woesearchaeota archaeon]MBI3026502.1 hypothetical protein [Candidatus Woesearchaeota archaeon]